MKEARYWMWTKNHNMRSHIQASPYNDSWEEQAFAEDSAGPLGGCIWPPRSYSCSFCRREFRSAQALGGHMNVHRRDRARLKQVPSPHNEIIHQHHQNHQNPCASLVVQNPSQVCTLVYNPSLNSDPSDIASPLSPSRVSAPSTQENCSEQTLVSPSFSSIIQEQQKVPLFSSCPSWPDSAFVNVLTVSDSRIEEDKEGGTKVCQNKSDPAVILNLLVRQNRSSELCDGDEETISSKRRRSDVTSLPSFFNSSSVDGHHFQAEVLGLGPSSMEDLDLELRLGGRPKVKSDCRTQMPE